MKILKTRRARTSAFLILKRTMLALALIGLAAAIPGRAQATFTPMPLDEGFGPMDLTPPSTSADQIVARFAAKESEFRAALENYTYSRSVREQTIDDDGKVDGQFYEATDISFDASGRRVERVTKAPANTLVRISMSPADFADIEQRLPFVLTREDLPLYDVTYVGKQKVDEIDCYVFDVKPKRIEKKRRYFQGKIWVDAQDYQIVVTNGKTVPDDTRKGHEDLSLPFTTYREQIDGKYWFPVYTKGDGVLHFSGGSGYLAEDVHLRLTIRYTGYRQFKSTVKIIYDGQEVKNDGTEKQQAPAPSDPSQSTAPVPQASPK